MAHCPHPSKPPGIWIHHLPWVLKVINNPTRGRCIFESPVEGEAISDIKTGFTGAVRAAGIDDLTFHDLRHTWSTRAAEPGVP